MEPIYRIDFNITSGDADRFGRLKASALLSMLQEAAGRQCVELDLSWEKLAQKNMFWAVTRQHIQITRLPKSGSTVTIETWPGTTSRVAYPRSSVGYDENGNELFRAISLWVLMDLKERKMILPRSSGISLTGISREGELAIPGSLAPVKLAGHAQRTVRFSELDRNGHMNNARYLDWMADLLPSSFHRDHPLAEFTVSYLSEATEGETVDLGYELTPEGELRLEAQQEGTDHRVFAIRAVYR